MVLELVLDSLVTLGAYKGAGVAKDKIQKSRILWTSGRWDKEYNAHRERVWKLEISTGVGLSNDTKEWLENRFQNKDIRVADRGAGMHRLAIEEHNGAVDTYCLACEKRYTPHYDHKGGKGTGYNYPGTTREQKRMMQKVCKECHDQWKGYVV